jgi:hypothetical protein
VEAIQCPSTDKWINKCGILTMEIYFSLEKEENSDVCYRMDEP